MKIKSKAPVKAVHKKAALFLEVDAINEKIKNRGLKDIFICDNTNPKINPTTFSHFKNKKEEYVTRSMIDRVNAFLDQQQ